MMHLALSGPQRMSPSIEDGAVGKSDTDMMDLCFLMPV